ncbi:hypothetical protein [Nonomuraea sp. NPDC023979]|uniref:hypothetical protein n=1 Tax=Nonomuraea sp. NPDC023979 TaxID=3154796 RepID=UPI0033EA71A1
MLSIPFVRAQQRTDEERLELLAKAFPRWDHERTPAGWTSTYKRAVGARMATAEVQQVITRESYPEQAAALADQAVAILLARRPDPGT